MKDDWGVNKKRKPNYFEGHFVRVHNDKEAFETDREYKKRMKREPEYLTVWEEYI